jgi:putative transposase
MTKESIALEELLRANGVSLNDGDVVRAVMGKLMQMLIEIEATQKIGAERYERSPERQTQRNGYRERLWDTRVGQMPLKIPKLREGSYFPSILEPRRQAERALRAVIMTAYVSGVSTRKMDELVRALGLEGIDKSSVSRMCAELDAIVEPFRQRRLEGSYPYVFLDAVYLKTRENNNVTNLALVIAIGVNEVGERTVLGFDVGASEEEAFWTAFLRQLVGRGLSGAQLVISDAHVGLRASIAKIFSGAAWQRCRVHFMRNLLAQIPHSDKSVVAAFVRTIFAQPNRKAASKQLAETVDLMTRRWPRAAELLSAAENDILAYMAFPEEHWTRIYSNNLSERTNREVRRRTDAVQLFPDRPSIIRLVGALLMEISDEWAVERRRYFSQASMAKLLPNGLALPRAPGPAVPPQ